MRRDIVRVGNEIDIQKNVHSDLWASSSLTPVKLDPDRTALMIVDMQYLDAHPDYGMGAVAKEAGHAKEFEWYRTTKEFEWYRTTMDTKS